MQPAGRGAEAAASARRHAEVVRRAFDAYQQEFHTITARAKGRFERADWSGTQEDARDRLALYGRVLDRVVGDLRAAMGAHATDPTRWAAMRAAYSELISGYPNMELAETFFNSVTRRVLGTVGVNPAVEYVDFQFARVPVGLLGERPYRTYQTNGDLARALVEMLHDFAFAIPYRDPDERARQIALQIAARWEEGVAPVPFEAVEVLDSIFYRRKGAYIVGRVRGGDRVMPLVIALVHDGTAIQADAVLLSEADVSVVFSFTRSYFHVDARRPADVIEFLKSLMPHKPLAELYSALGHNKHGKTEFYRDLYRHLDRSDERFVHAPGARGMVMAVFTLPSFDVVFKVIRDVFDYPKQTTRERVRERYRLVFQHDRAGRLVDAQEFEHLEFAASRFAPDLLEELLATASRSVALEGDRVVIRHLYTERRVRPLNLYLRDADPERALRAVLDYGRAVRDLASTNVFPGDLLLKNFGVTRHGRVIFYDYDELCLLSDCRFREIPEARYPEDELDAEPWFHVGPHDVFPEELVRFLELKGGLRERFLGEHACLFRPPFWRDLQSRLASGEVLDVVPYPSDRRLNAP